MQLENYRHQPLFPEVLLIFSSRQIQELNIFLEHGHMVTLLHLNQTNVKIPVAI